MANKFNLNQLMNEKSKSVSVKDAIAFKVDLIPIDKIEPSKMNKYSVDDVEELKLSIELTGLQQNLLVRQRDGADIYEIISGHRRFKALQELNAAGNDNYAYIPCKIVKSVDDIQAELQLILANSTSRRLTDFEITYQAARLKELLTELKKGGFKFTGRTREVIAELLHVSPSQIGRMESINNNLSPELKDEFRQENINITTAYELSKLDGEQQERALEEHKSGVTLTPDKIKQRKEKPPEAPPLTKPEIEIMDGQLDFFSEETENAQPIKTPTPSNKPPASETAGAAQEKREQEAADALTPEIKIDHKLKIYPDEFNAVKSGLKTFEYRLNDRGYKTGDILSLCEYEPKTKHFTGEYIDVKVIYMLDGGKYGVPTGYVIMSITHI